MKNTLARVFGFLLFGIFAAQALAQSEIPNGGGRLAGTWDAVVTIRICNSGNPIASFQSTASFDQGGTYTGITSGRPPAARTPELGVWEHVSGNQYRFRFKAYHFDNGIPQGYDIVTHDIELDNDNQNYTSAGTAKFYNLAGVLTGSGCSTAVGTRMLLD